jgi:hypothetical protein
MSASALRVAIDAIAATLTANEALAAAVCDATDDAEALAAAVSISRNCEATTCVAECA